jgi:hypothetical protein
MKEVPLLVAFVLIAGVAQNAASVTTSTHQQLAERFVTAATPEPMPSLDESADILAEELIRANPGREAEARRIAREMLKCLSPDGNAGMRQPAIEAALAFDNQQLERLISFVEMRKAQHRKGAPNRLPPGWEAARQDYGRWMYSIGGQPSAVASAQRCGDKMAASMAAAGFRN